MIQLPQNDLPNGLAQLLFQQAVWIKTVDSGALQRISFDSETVCQI